MFYHKEEKFEDDNPGQGDDDLMVDLLPSVSERPVPPSAVSPPRLNYTAPKMPRSQPTNTIQSRDKARNQHPKLRAKSIR